MVRPPLGKIVPLSIQINPPLKASGNPPRMMLRHLQGKPNTWNSQNHFSSARTNPPSMDGAPLLLETLAGAPSLSLPLQLM